LGDIAAKEFASYVEKMHPGLNFYFWPSLIAFPFENIYDLAKQMFSEIKRTKPQLLNEILFDQAVVGFLTTKQGGNVVFLTCLRNLAHDQAGLFMKQRRFPPMQNWPKEIESGLTAI
jgi:hypothetical protein